MKFYAYLDTEEFKFKAISHNIIKVLGWRYNKIDSQKMIKDVGALHVERKKAFDHRYRLVQFEPKKVGDEKLLLDCFQNGGIDDSA